MNELQKTADKPLNKLHTPPNDFQNSLLHFESERDTINLLQASLPPEREISMKGQNSRNGKALITALYSRLSKDDELLGQSQSVSNQKIDLETYAKANGFANLRHYSEMKTASLIQINFEGAIHRIRQKPLLQGLLRLRAIFSRFDFWLGLVTFLPIFIFGVDFDAPPSPIFGRGIIKKYRQN